MKYLAQRTATAWRAALVSPNAVSRRRRLVAVVMTLIVWEISSALLASTGDPLAQSKLPYPHRLLATMVGQGSTLIDAAWATSRGAFVGLALGTAVGFGLGIAMTLARWIEDATYPYVIGAQMIPTIALAPIVMGALQDADVTRIVVAAYISFFAVSLGTIKGLKSTSGDYLALMATLNTTRWQTFRMLRLPSALPYFFAGLKVAAPLAVVGEIVVELTGSNDGLGTLLLTALYYGPSYAYTFWAAILATMGLGLAFSGLAVLLERILSPWQPEFRTRA